MCLVYIKAKGFIFNFDKIPFNFDLFVKWET